VGKCHILKASVSHVLRVGFARCQWLPSIILATQEAEIRRFTVQISPGKYFPRPYLEKHSSLKRANGVTQVVKAPA
jgi:hypothetical protein